MNELPKMNIRAAYADQTADGKNIDNFIADAEERITELETTVGDSTAGLVKQVADLETAVGDADSGLVKKVADLETTVGDSTAGLVKQVSDLETTVGDADSGLVKQVNDNTTAISGFVSGTKLYKHVITNASIAKLIIITDNATPYDYSALYTLLYRDVNYTLISMFYVAGTDYPTWPVLFFKGPSATIGRFYHYNTSENFVSDDFAILEITDTVTAL